MMHNEQRPQTTEQLRKNIDSGQTGEKVDWPDPAAAPLGTDAEASGNPPKAATIAKAEPAKSAPTPLHSSMGAALTYVAVACGLLIVAGALVVTAG